MTTSPPLAQVRERVALTQWLPVRVLVAVSFGKGGRFLTPTIRQPVCTGKNHNHSLDTDINIPFTRLDKVYQAHRKRAHDTEQHQGEPKSQVAKTTTHTEDGPPVRQEQQEGEEVPQCQNTPSVNHQNPSLAPHATLAVTTRTPAIARLISKARA